MADTAEEVHGRGEGYWHANTEGQREDPAEEFPRALHEYRDSFQNTESLPAM